MRESNAGRRRRERHHPYQFNLAARSLQHAMPEFSPRPVSDTKTQQPSFDGATMKGAAGRGRVTDGEGAGALQSPV